MTLKKCKSCGNSIDNGLIICPNCGSSPNKEKEQSLSPDQVKQLSKQIRKELAKTVFAWLGALSLIFGVGLWQAYRSATDQIKELLIIRISNEFDQPIIRKTVQEVASQNAKTILKSEIQPEVIKFKTDMGSELTKIRGIVDSAQAQMNDLTTLIEIYDAAHYGSREAFSKLLKIAGRNDSFGEMAKRNILMINRELSLYRSVPGAYFGLSFTNNGETRDANALSTHELFLYLENPNTVKEHIPALMAHIVHSAPQRTPLWVI